MSFLKKIEAALNVEELRRGEAFRDFSKASKVLRGHLDDDQLKALDECLNKIRPSFVKLGGM